MSFTVQVNDGKANGVQVKQFANSQVCEIIVKMYPTEIFIHFDPLKIVF